MNPASRSRARAVVARALVGDAPAPLVLGSIALRPAQLETAFRARAAIARHGGVLIADDVGAGKTYVALAIASAYGRPVVLAPAVLRSMWMEASARARVPIRFASIESLGRGTPAPSGADLVVVDEAHHLRNPATRRYAAARAATAGTRVVLLSATPVHNVARDLDALLTLFLGAAARDLDNEGRAQVIVRASKPQTGPPVVVHKPVAVRDARCVIRALRALPSAIPPRDGGDAPALVHLALLRAWCSSVGALTSMLRRAALQGAAIRDALRAGRHPTRAELGAWSMTGDGQLAFAELMTQNAVDAPADLPRIDEYLATLAETRQLVSGYSSLDDERAERVRRIAAAHAGVPVLACTQYAATVDALWKRMRGDPQVAALTSRGARIASGPATREQALARFAPQAVGAPPPHERERIRLLLATDLVSEGLNLHDAGVVIHLDLPWTSARLAQRVGRVARFGSVHECVHVHTLAPPRAAAALLALERRLQRKRRLASQLVGGADRIAALLGGTAARRTSAAEGRARIAELLAPHACASGHAEPIVCGIEAPRHGWLALVTSADGHRLVARIGGSAPTADPATVATAVEWLVMREEAWLPASWPLIRGDAERWLARDRARKLAGAGRPHAARAHGPALATAVGAVAASPPHLRARQAEQAAAVLRAHGNTALEQSLLALVVFCTHVRPPCCPAV